MTIAFRAGSNGSGTTTVQCSAPTGFTTGDTLVAWVVDGGTSGFIAAPTGWTQLSGISGASGRITLFKAQYGDSGLGTGPWTWTTTTPSGACIVAYSGSAAVTTPSACRYNASGTYGTAGQSSTTSAQLVVAYFSSLPFGMRTWSAYSCTNPGTLTERYGAGAGGVADGFMTSIGASGATTATPNSAIVNVGSVIILTSSAVDKSLVTLDSSEAFGSGSIALTSSLAGLSSSEIVGSPTALWAQLIMVLGIASNGVFGSPEIGLQVSTEGIPSEEIFGLLSLYISIFLTGITSQEAFGQPTILARAFSLVRFGLIKYNQGIYNMPIGEYTKDTTPTTPYS